MFHRFSQVFLPTLKETPADAISVSHVLLLRAGYVRQVGAGIYNYLPLAFRVLRKIETILRRELDAAGALEVRMPVVLPAELYRETGRWDLYGDVLARFKDRRGHDHLVGPTHEEVATDIVRRDVKSYRQLPVNIYQIQVKFRDEARPRSGILRTRELIMADSYSYDIDDAAAARTYEKIRAAFERVFDAMGVTYRVVAADNGEMGGGGSHEFQILAQSGEDAIVACDNCDYAANVEAAEVGHRGAAPSADAGGASPAAEVHTPGHGTMADVASFLGLTPAQGLKSLIYVTPENALVMACVRGDHEVNEIKLARVLGVGAVHLASEPDVRKATGAKIGFAGPVGFAGRVVVDPEAAALRDAYAGANRDDYHRTGVNFDRGDYRADVHPIRLARGGDPCPRCETGHFKSYKGIEGAHIFMLGTRYTAAMGATVVDESGNDRALIMNCYGLGVSRVLAATVEQHNDADGIRWPVAIAPYHVHLCTLGGDEAVLAAGETLARALDARGIEVLWDDRDERPGVKFKDADLIGVPFRITLGPKTLARNECEFKRRDQRDPKAFEGLALEGAAERIAALVARP